MKKVVIIRLVSLHITISHDGSEPLAYNNTLAYMPTTSTF